MKKKKNMTENKNNNVGILEYFLCNVHLFFCIVPKFFVMLQILKIKFYFVIICEFLYVVNNTVPNLCGLRP